MANAGGPRAEALASLGADLSPPDSTLYGARRHTRDRVPDRQLPEAGASRHGVRGEAKRHPPTFDSILFPDAGDAREPSEPPDYFVDLNLDQIVESITAGRHEYDLKPFFHAPQTKIDTIAYRHEVLHDLEQKTVSRAVTDFTQAARDVRKNLAIVEKLYYARQKQAVFLDAVEVYCAAVRRLSDDLAVGDLASRGFRALRDYLARYMAGRTFTTIEAETGTLRAGLAAARYSLLIKGSAVTVRRYDSEPDYSVDVLATFDKFKQGAVKTYTDKFHNVLEMNHIEAGILDFVAQLHPETFAALASYCARNADFFDPVIRRFDREVQFYAAYLEHVARITDAGLAFSYPRLSTSKEIHVRDAFDLALANKLLREDKPVVCNDVFLKGKERILVVSGPNQGGKTTFARMFGQMHYLAALGLPVPGRDARLFLFDRLFTHFEREESIETLRGKLEDDLVRMHAILAQATPRSIIIVNEIFTSTSLQDAVRLGKTVMTKIMDRDAICVCVTFLDELASLSEKTVSMMSTVVPENPANRTFRIVRRPADGLAYALSVAERYRVTHKWLKERIKP
jgi:DNA mismatch repair protein MutS